MATLYVLSLACIAVGSPLQVWLSTLEAAEAANDCAFGYDEAEEDAYLEAERRKERARQARRAASKARTTASVAAAAARRTDSLSRGYATTTYETSVRRSRYGGGYSRI